MAMLPDATVLEAVARRIGGHADDLRSRASRLAATAEGVRWHSTAAAAFRCEVHDLACRFRRTAGEVDEAAHSLRQHAAAVRRAETVVRAAERTAMAAVHGVAHVLGL
jgi:uncharacterized protein YukE